LHLIKPKMDDDSDESEYVDDIEHKSVGRKTRGQAKISTKERPRHARVKREAPHDPSAALEDQPDSKGIKGAATQKPNPDALRSYRDLLNANIAEALAPREDVGPDALQPSQFGISFWTTKEKHRLFTAMNSHGPGDLPALATAIGTKSEPEIKAYILLLQEGVRELDAKVTQQFGPADVPSAIETSSDLLEAEESLAAVIEGRAKAVEEAGEKQKWGEETWLIDEDAAAVMEERHGNPEEPDIKAGAIEKDQTGTVHTDNRPLSSDQLLKASTFLQLSRSLFMNSTNPDMNWHTISEEDESNPRPAIRRTAFDDFHNLVVSLTRRLMQASLFQAMSRLRASSDQRLLPHVNGFDVIAARETMGLKTQRPEYWAAAVKRCGVEVYSDSKKWKAQEGRQGTKNGVKLSDNELQAELGVLIPHEAEHVANTLDANEDDVSAESSDSDAYTIASSSENSDGELSDVEVAVDARGRILKDRRRPLSPTSFCRAEKRYLERVDRHNAEDLDIEYRDILGLPAAAHKRPSKPGFPYKQADIEPRPKDWRAVVHYEAPWEQPQGIPRQRDFDAMDMEGARRRKRRRLVIEESGETMESNESEPQQATNVGSEADDGTESEDSTASSSEEEGENDDDDAAPENSDTGESEAE
jgi:RNA polymerase I-specific transcription initiation factor RRN5